MRFLLTVAFVALLPTFVSAAPIVVDEFDAGPTTLSHSFGTAAATLTQTGLPVLGGERNIILDTFSSQLSTATSTFTVNTAGGGIGFLENATGADTLVTLFYDEGGPHDLLIDDSGLNGTPSSTFITFDMASSSGLVITASAEDTDGDIATSTAISTAGPPGGATIETTDPFSDWTQTTTVVDSVDFDKIKTLSVTFLAGSGSDFFLNSISVNTSLPEPSSLVMMGSLLGLGIVFRRRRK